MSEPPSDRPTIRAARPADRDAVVEYNALLAIETERKVLDPATLTAGVEAALAEPDRIRYWVAEAEGQVIGQAAITREWSDWRNGWLWWLQSVYVEAPWRGRGVLRALVEEIRAEARAAGDVIGLRLYVEQDNTAAQAVYRALGFTPGGYLVYEDIWGVPRP